MSKFNKTTLISVFSKLGERLITPDEQLLTAVNNEKQYNAWFTPESVLDALKAIGMMLNPHDLDKWLARYDIDKNSTSTPVGLILAGNIPLVGFHDILCVLCSGNYALIKSSSQDARLIRQVLELLVSIEPGFKDRFKFVDRLDEFHAIIATGSNNTSRYFEYYFGKVPHIIRKNRNSVAVLTGHETSEHLCELGHDIFDYYGLGCRNVSKLFVPKDYDFTFFFESIEEYQPIINHHKYNNNYDYNKSIYLVNGDKHLDNGFLMLKEDERLASPLAVVFYEYYDNINAVQQTLQTVSDQVQCIVSAAPLQVTNQVVGFGKSQQPALWDYADGVDTMAFLLDMRQSTFTKF